MSSSHWESRSATSGGRFDFDDGGTYCGGWEDGKAHGYGVCTGPKGQGEYSGSWHYGFEVSGVYTWPSGSNYEGQWQNGKRHGLGVETRGSWMYRGEWTQGLKGRYGVRQSMTSEAKYEGTWANGLQDGYGSETYADGGIYQGQWLRGLRHGYGVRNSAPFGLASHSRPKNARFSVSSLEHDHVDPASIRNRKIDDCRGGFVLKAKSDEPPPRRRSLVDKSSTLKKTILQTLKLRKQRSTGDINRKEGSSSFRSTRSTGSSGSSEYSPSGLTRTSGRTDSSVSFVSQDDVMDTNVVEAYMGEWKNDKRCGFGISERSDGLKYEGEWYNNKKYGYGVTSFKDGTREEGKYKNNILLTSGKKKHLFLLRSTRIRERVGAAVNAAVRASQLALQKADIGISRTATARDKAEQADIAAKNAIEESNFARIIAKQFAPEFQQPGFHLLRTNLPEVSKLKVSGNPLQDTPQRSKSLYCPSVSASRDNISDNPGIQKGVESPAVEGLTLNIDEFSAKTPQGSQAPTPAPEPYQGGRKHSSFLDPPSGEPLNCTPQGSFRRAKEPNPPDSERSYTFQHALAEHFDHYRSNPSNSRSRAKHSRKTTNPPTIILAPLRQRQDCTPDSGVSETMDGEEQSPGRVPRRSTLPNLYAENFQAEAYLAEGDGEEGQQPNNAGPLKRKKSLPNVESLVEKTYVMSREEVAELSSQRREEIRRSQEEAERLRANPLLYLFNPDLRDWLSRQQLVMIVLFINISLAIMFFKLLT
ncbi:junctophilin-1-like [Tachypleus tridentatus]|uniref:junctophilin-1-like n=1 Tax=Tachypleus tridentatus TaxID=6853 RepID=UPI003FD08427